MVLPTEELKASQEKALEAARDLEKLQEQFAELATKGSATPQDFINGWHKYEQIYLLRKVISGAPRNMASDAGIDTVMNAIDQPGTARELAAATEIIKNFKRETKIVLYENENPNIMGEKYLAPYEQLNAINFFYGMAKLAEESLVPKIQSGTGLKGN